MIPHNRPSIGIEEEIAATRTIRSGWLAQSCEVEAFEGELSDFLGLKSGGVVAVSSGSAAIYLSLLALNARNKKVAIPSYTCSSLRQASTLAGAIPVIVDIAADSPNVNPQHISGSMESAD